MQTCFNSEFWTYFFGHFNLSEKRSCSEIQRQLLQISGLWLTGTWYFLFLFLSF